MLEKVNDYEDKDKMDNDPTGNDRPVEDDEFLVNEDELEDLEFGGAEFSSLNSALDQLQGALDNLESRNAGIHEELLELLQSNREVRRVMMEERQNSVNSGATSDITTTGQKQADIGSSSGTQVSRDTEDKTLFSSTSPVSLSSTSSDKQNVTEGDQMASLPELLQQFVKVNDRSESESQSQNTL